MNKLYRQGDLLIKSIEVLPSNLKKVGSTLAFGEHSGHKHQLLERTANQFQVFEDSIGNKYLQLNQPTDLVHEEHKTITIEKGLWFIQNEREYNYFELEIQRVVD